MLRRSFLSLQKPQHQVPRTRLFARLPEQSSSSSSSNTTAVASPSNNNLSNGLNKTAVSTQKGGRTFDDEEKQCGMLFTISELRQQHIFAANISSSRKNNKNGHQTTRQAMQDKSQMVFVADSSSNNNSGVVNRRLGCVVKGCSADWQVNEIYSTTSSSVNDMMNNDDDDGMISTSSNSATSKAGTSNDFITSSSSCSLGSRLQQNQEEEEDHNSTAAAVTTLTKMPKGSWKKISGAVKKQVETDQETAHSDPAKHFREMFISRGTYAYKKGKIPVDRNHLEFSLYRENTPLKAVMRRMQKKLRIKPETKLFDSLLLQQQPEESTTTNENFFQMISQKESYGCVTQVGRIQGISSELLPHASRHYNINAVLFNPLRYIDAASTPSLSSTFCGNRWRVMLRCVDGTKSEIESALSHLATNGAINYFPLRSLGGAAGGGSAIDIASSVSRGDYFDACRFWLQNEASRDILFAPHYSRYLAADSGSVGGLMEMAARDLFDAKASPHLIQVTRFLADFYKNNNNPAPNSTAILDDEVCKNLYETIVSRALDQTAVNEAPENFLWNLAASQRLYKSGFDQIVAGDYVLVNSDGTSKNTTRVKRIESDQEGKQYNVADHLVIPFVNQNASSSCWYSEFYKSATEKFGLEKCFQVKNNSNNNKNMMLRFRKAILKPTSPMQAVVVSDPNSLSLLKTDLFLRQERKHTENNGEGVTLEERFRKPTQFNVSDAFRTLMQPSIHNPPASTTPSSSTKTNPKLSQSRCSVAIEVDLPCGSHILPFLRETFLVKHLHYSDQLDIVSCY